MNYQEGFNKFYNQYKTPSNRLFLERNVDVLYEQSKRDAELNPVSKQEIKKYSNALATKSRDKERRILRGRKRYLSFRKWKTYGPNNILLGDLAFLRSLKGKNDKKYIILVFLDAFR